MFVRGMERPIRVARQKAMRSGGGVSGGIVGLHPTEEAAIKKALRASMQVQKNLTTDPMPKTPAKPESVIIVPCQIMPQISDVMPSLLKAPLDVVTHHSKSICLLECIGSQSKEHQISKLSISLTNQTLVDGNCLCKRLKCTDQSKNCKSKGYKVREHTETSEFVSPQHKSPRTFQAQRKFTQNFEPVPVQKIFTPTISNISDLPKTEDFISFLCLRSEPMLWC